MADDSHPRHPLHIGRKASILSPGDIDAATGIELKSLAAIGFVIEATLKMVFFGAGVLS